MFKSCSRVSKLRIWLLKGWGYVWSWLCRHVRLNNSAHVDRGRVKGLACAGPGARTPIGVSRISYTLLESDHLKLSNSLILFLLPYFRFRIEYTDFGLHRTLWSHICCCNNFTWTFSSLYFHPIGIVSCWPPWAPSTKESLVTKQIYVWKCNTLSEVSVNNLAL